MNATTTHAINDGFKWHIDFKHKVDCYSRIFHGLCLGDSAWKAIKQIAVAAVGFFKTIFYKTNNDVIGNEAACIHNLFCSNAEGRACFHSSS